MSDVNFGCCSSYQECSDKGTCIKKDMMNNCNYWIRNLSKGINFYSKENHIPSQINLHKEKAYAAEIPVDEINRIVNEKVSHILANKPGQISMFDL